MRLIWSALTLLILLNVVFLLVFYGNWGHTQVPHKRVYLNRCSNTTKLMKRPMEPRPPTLVIYVYAETNEIKTRNLEYFLLHGLCEHCANIDYVFVLNGETHVNIPGHRNVRILRRPNVCGDFGAWMQLFQQMDPEKYKKYKRFMFVNDTVKGPFIDPHYYAFFPQDFHFTDIFASYLTNETRMIGSYLSCGAYRTQDGFSHVQTMSFMIDNVALELVRPLIRCYSNKTDTIRLGEIGFSKRLLSENINIGSLLYAFRGVDFRCNDEMRLDCNERLNPSIEGQYYGNSPNPTEVVFFKDTVQINARMLELYSQWLPRIGDII